MKKSFLILFGTLLLAACGTDSATKNDKEQEETPTIEESEDKSNESVAGDDLDGSKTDDDSKDKVQSDNALSTENDNLQELPEFDVLSETIDLNEYTSTIQTDNKGNRVITFADGSGHKEFKSVFVKKKNRLKIVSLLDDDLLYNEVIQNGNSEHAKNKESKKDLAKSTNNDGIKSYPEFNKLAENIDLDVYAGTVQTDNRGNRIITFADANGHKKYKSIFVKKKNRLKIVHFEDDGLIFNQII